MREAGRLRGAPVTGRGDVPDRASGPRGWVAARVTGGRWWVRAPLLAVLAWIGWRIFENPLAPSIFDGITLGFHEMGHAFFSWSGHRILTAAGGTLFQLGVPLAAALYLLLRQNDPFGATVCLFWLGTALVGAGIYAADARAQALPLVSPFGPVDVDSHDWTVVLMKYGMLSRDEVIGGWLQRTGFVAMLVSLLLGAWVLRVMAVASRETARG